MILYNMVVDKKLQPKQGCARLNFLGVQGWQVVAKSGLNHCFLPVKTGWQKMRVANSGKK